jgi:hypothetical protein
VAFSPAGTWIVASDNAAVTHVLDVTVDKQLAELKDMHSPVLSPQGDILMTVSNANFILWSTSDWTQKRTLPRSPAYAIPLALNPEADSFVITSSGIFRLLRLSTGEPLPNASNPELPNFNGAAGGFAAFGTSNAVFGHSDDRLWAWNTSNAQTCVSDLMYSESGSLSQDGTILAGAIDNSILAHTIWRRSLDLGYKQAGGEVFQRQEMTRMSNFCNIAAPFIGGVIKVAPVDPERLNQSVVQIGLSEPVRCAISVPCASIPCALKRFFSIPELIASVRA